MIPTRRLGNTGVDVTCLGLGGEGVLRTFGQNKAARAVILAALEQGITYLESARAYDDSEVYYGESLGAWRNQVFLASKAHARSARGAEQMLQATLANLKTDRLDLWQVHDVRTDEDLERIFGPGGAIEAFDRAKRDGRVRFVGITGHHDPQILLKAFDLYPFDTVLLPVNPAEPAWRSFPQSVVPDATRRGMGIIGMKVLCRGFGLQVPGSSEAARWIRYALAHEVSTMVIGCDNPAHVIKNAAAARQPPLPMDDRHELERLVAPYARELMYYKPS
ncbi:MAG: aldo/keto reductase [Desulfuromonadales bacterium]|nr:aldo/keto reductase [Desulfuromonadales bacterium]